MFPLKMRERGNEEAGAVSHHSFGIREDVPLTTASCRPPSIEMPIAERL